MLPPNQCIAAGKTDRAVGTVARHALFCFFTHIHHHATDRAVVRIAGATLPSGQPLTGDAFPGRYPLHLYRAATGAPLPNEASYEDEFRAALETQLRAKVLAVKSPAA